MDESQTQNLGMTYAMNLLEHGFDEEVLNSLEHHGVKGQKHGVRHGPPYPLKGNDLSQAVKAWKKRRKQNAVKKEKEKAKKQAAKNEVKQRQEEEKAAERQRKAQAEAQKKKDQYSKSAGSLYKHREMYTKDEVRDALERFKWEEDLRQMSRKELDHNKQVWSSMIGYANNAVTTWNTIARVYNAYASTQGDVKPLPYVPAAGGNDQKKK